MKKNKSIFNNKELRREFNSLIRNIEASKDEYKALEKRILYKIKITPKHAFSPKVLYADLMAFMGNYSRSNKYYYMAIIENQNAYWILYCISKNLLNLNQEQEALGYLKTLNKIQGNNGCCDLNILIGLLEKLIIDKQIDLEYSDKMFSRQLAGDSILSCYKRIIELLNKNEYNEVLSLIDTLKNRDEFTCINGDLTFIEKIIDRIIKREDYENILGLDQEYRLLEKKMLIEEYADVFQIIKEILLTDENPKMNIYRYLNDLIYKGYINECKETLNGITNNGEIIKILLNTINDLENDIDEDIYYINESKAYEESNMELALQYAFEGYNNTENPIYAYLVGSLLSDLNMDADAIKYLEISAKHKGKNYLKSIKKLYRIMDRNGEYEKAIMYFDQYSRIKEIYENNQVLKPFFKSSFNDNSAVIDEYLYNEIADYIQFGYFDIAEEMIKRLQNKKDKNSLEKNTLKKINNNKKLLLMKQKRADE